MALKNLVDKKFGRITVLKYMGCNKNKNSLWLCRCDCSKEKVIIGNNLVRGFTKSCGCLQREVCSKNKKSHGRSNTRLFHIWQSMIDRCVNSKNKRYKNYGGRGITICNEWKDDFQKFYEWAITNGYKEEILPNGINKWTIDRIDNNGNYEPNNCRWATNMQQCNNTSINVIIKHGNETHTLSEWCRIYNIQTQTAGDRILRGITDFNKIFYKGRLRKSKGE